MTAIIITAIYFLFNLGTYYILIDRKKLTKTWEHVAFILVGFPALVICFIIDNFIPRL